MWGCRFFKLQIYLMSFVLFFSTSSRCWADTSYKYEVSGQFHGIGPNAGGVTVLGASFKYQWFEVSAAYNAALGFTPGLAYRIDINEDSFFVPHVSLGLPMFGPGFNIRM